MVSAVNILNLQAQANQVRQNGGNSEGSSFLDFFRSAAASVNNSQNIIRENILNNAAGMNDINAVDDSEGLPVLARAINGETEEMGAAAVIEEIKREIARILVIDDGEKIDISKVLEMLGMPVDAIPAIISAMLIDPEMIFENNGAAAALLSLSDAGSVISEIAQYIYAGNAGDIMPEQVQENVADFADILDNTGEAKDFKSAVADYVAEKVGASTRLNAENIKEAVKQALSGEAAPEAEILSAVKTNEAAASSIHDIINVMKMGRAQVQTLVMPEVQQSGLAQADTTEEVIEIIPAEPVAANAADSNNLVNLANAQNLSSEIEAEIDIENFSRDISQVIAERAESMLNQAQINRIPGRIEAYEVRLRLSPAELGEVFLKITYRDGTVGLNIVASNAIAERAILNQMGDLRESLSAHDIDLADFNLSNFENNARNQQQDTRENNRGNGGLAENARETAAQREAERREAVANYIRSRRIFYKTI